MLSYQKISRLLLPSLTLSSVLVSSLNFAGTMGPLPVDSWRPVISLGGGAAFGYNVGRAQNFPIFNPLTDEFYNYSATHRSQTVGLFDAFIGAEWAPQPLWAVQFGLGYTYAETFHPKGTFLQGADLQSADVYSYRYQITASQLLAESKLLFNYQNIFHPYALVGLGGSFNKASNYKTNVPPTLTFTRVYRSHTETSFTYTLGTGLDFDVTQHFRLGVGYRFIDFGQVRLGSAKIDTTPVRGTLVQNHLYANTVLGQITYVI